MSENTSILFNARNSKMVFHPATFSLVDSGIHVLLAIENFASASMRNGRVAYSRVNFRSGFKRISIAMGVTLVASWLCLSLPLPEKLIMPSGLMGGIHPASMEILLTSANKIITGMK